MVSTFYRIYRPKKFSDLVGQENIRKLLEKSILENRPSQAYLFTGPRGTGKTTTARIFAKALNCLTPLKEREGAEPCEKCQNCQLIESGQTLDLTEIDAASYTGVDNIRQITENINLAPANLRYRIFIIDEVHMLSKGAFNALLKTLEEPPAHAVFILATTEYAKVPQTVASRCQKYFFRLFKTEEIISKLKKIALEEQIEIEQESLSLIAEAAEGGMRDAESLFSQIASTGDKQISKKDVLSSLRIANRSEENLFLEELLSKNSIAALAVFDRLVNQGIDSFMLSHRFLEKLRRILLLKINSSAEDLLAAELDEAEISKIKKLAGSATISDILNLTMRFLQAQPLIKNSSLPYLPLELSIVEFCAPKETGSPTPAKDLEPKQKKSGTKVMAESKEKKEVKKIKKIKKSSTENKSPEKKVEKEKDEDIQETKKPIADLSAVMSSWPKILEKMKDLQPALLSILRVSSPVKIEDETLIISTPFKFHQEKLNEAKNRAIFCAELKTATGIEKICVLEDKAVKVEPKKEEELVDQVKNLLNL